MTIKDLATFTGKTERTIQNWVQKSNEVFSEINEKISLVKGQETNLTIDQVETILNHGTMSKDAVNILMQNARNQQLQLIDNNPMTAMLTFMAKMQEQQQQFMTAVLGEIKNISKVSNQLQITAPKEDYFSLLAYCSLHNIKTNRSELALHGKELRKLTLDKNMDLKKIPDERWGSVNSYPVEVLNEYFAV